MHLKRPVNRTKVELEVVRRRLVRIQRGSKAQHKRAPRVGAAECDVDRTISGYRVEVIPNNAMTRLKSMESIIVLQQVCCSSPLQRSHARA
jgi:hypothetical protein